jgi:hypothetical protein
MWTSFGGEMVDQGNPEPVVEVNGSAEPKPPAQATRRGLRLAVLVLLIVVGILTFLYIMGRNDPRTFKAIFANAAQNEQNHTVVVMFILQDTSGNPARISGQAQVTLKQDGKTLFDRSMPAPFESFQDYISNGEHYPAWGTTVYDADMLTAPHAGNIDVSIQFQPSNGGKLSDSQVITYR